jgi:hypothetical protein
MYERRMMLDYPVKRLCIHLWLSLREKDAKLSANSSRWCLSCRRTGREPTVDCQAAPGNL